MSQPPPPPYGSQSQSVPVKVGMPPQYGSPPHSGSLGTPNVGWSPSSLGDGRWKQHGSHGRGGNRPGSGQGQAGQQAPRDIILVPTRPLLKALARELKPLPPWTVGANPFPENLSAELHTFAKFLQFSPLELERTKVVRDTAKDVIRGVWPKAELKPMGINAAGVMSPDGTQHYYADGTEEDLTGGEEGAANMDDIVAKLRALANDQGYQAEFFTDYRDCPTAVFTEARTGDKIAVRYGPKIPNTKVTADLLATQIGAMEDRRVALAAIESLLRQNKVLDESGKTAGLASEAVAVMLLSIANSYDPTDPPVAERLLSDFFLTFGFPAHFDNAKLSVNYQGMAKQTPKIHKDSQLSVLDPADGTTNLTGRVEKVPHILAVFNYCYTAISQFTVTMESQRTSGGGASRAQSALSTVIGGETYWSRVLHLYHQKVEPFHSVVVAVSGKLVSFT